MGYYTDFCIRITDTTEHRTSEKLIKEVSSWLNQHTDYYGNFDVVGDDIVIYGVKWYDHNDDMYRLSIAFPDVLFDVHGVGESTEDIWENHWQNGNFQYCRAEIPPYDPLKMKPYKP